MPKGLSEGLRVRIITLREEGYSTREIARRVSVSQSCVVTTLQRYHDMANLADRPRSGRPTVLTAAQKRYIKLLTARDPTINATKIKAELRAATGREVSTQTIRNCLHQVGLRARRSWRAPLNSRQRQRHRLQWARLRQIEEDENENIWHNCLFVDESRTVLIRITDVFASGEDLETRRGKELPLELFSKVENRCPFGAE